MFEPSPHETHSDLPPGLESPAEFEFRDQRLSAQYGLGGIAGIGAVGTILCLKNAAGAPIYFTAAGALAVGSLVALAFVYFRFGKPIVLRQTEEGLVMVRGTEEYRLPFDRLIGLVANWTDVFRNNIYSHTHVRFEFHAECDAEEAALAIMKYDATATYGTSKYEDLQAFQVRVAAVVADRMSRILAAEGRVAWTSRMALEQDGLAFSKTPGGEPTFLEFSRISRWELDQGLFKLALDGEKKPLFAERTGQLNFFPGLLLFQHLKEPADVDTSAIIDESELVSGAAQR